MPSNLPTSTQYLVKQVTSEQHSIETEPFNDTVAIEMPLIIRYSPCDNPEEIINLATLLRTPTNDEYLAYGFMYAEGYLSSPEQIAMLHYCEDDDAITIVSDEEIKTTRRAHLTHAGCGTCALEIIENLYQNLCKLKPFHLSHEFLFKLISTPPTQPLFQQSGGTHAALVLDEHANVLSQDEDIGRHNALDKAIGKLWFEGGLEQARVVWVSGRIGFELVQKCINAGIPNIISVGAPTSLSIDYAKKYGLELYSFARNNRFNKYT